MQSDEQPGPPTFQLTLFPIQETFSNIQRSVLLLLMYLLNYIEHPILPPFLLNQDGHNMGPNQDIQEHPPPQERTPVISICPASFLLPQQQLPFLLEYPLSHSQPVVQVQLNLSSFCSPGQQLVRGWVQDPGSFLGMSLNQLCRRSSLLLLCCESGMANSQLGHEPEEDEQG